MDRHEEGAHDAPQEFTHFRCQGQRPHGGRLREGIHLCHLLSLTNATLSFELCPEHHSIRAFCRVRTSDKTGVEMEALTGVSVALLTVYDICKAIDERMVVRDVHLVEKTGGTSESFQFWKPCSGPLFIREISFMK